MNKLFLFTGALAILTTTGCIVAEEGHGYGHGHHEYRGHSTVYVPAPVVVVPVAPVIHVREN